MSWIWKSIESENIIIVARGWIEKRWGNDYKWSCLFFLSHETTWELNNSDHLTIYEYAKICLTKVQKHILWHVTCIHIINDLILKKYVCLFVCFILGFELRAYTLNHSTYCDRVFQDRVSQTVCHAGFKLQSSWSLPPE
jgi:hypothetical protein